MAHIEDFGAASASSLNRETTKETRWSSQACDDP
jgi:hypothetical protein